MARDEGLGTGSAGELMVLIRRLLRLRKGVGVAFEAGMVVMEDWVWLRKYVKPRILERGVKVDEAGLSVGSGDDSDAVGINECFEGNEGYSEWWSAIMLIRCCCGRVWYRFSTASNTKSLPSFIRRGRAFST